MLEKLASYRFNRGLLSQPCPTLPVSCSVIAENSDHVMSMSGAFPVSFTQMIAIGAEF